MADPVVLSSAAIWFGGYDITGELDMVRLEARRAELKDCRFGDDIETYFPGVQSIDLDVAGFRNSAADGSETVIAAPRVITKEASAWPVTLAPPYAPAATPGADGNIAYNLRGCQTAYNLQDMAHGNSLKFELKSRARSGNGVLDRLTVVLPKTTYAATTTGTGRQLGAITATQKMVAVLHVFTVTGGGSWVLTVESDDNSGFTTPIVRATFTAATAITRQAVDIAGAVTDDWWRVVFTKTGGTSIVGAALLGINNL